MAKKKSAKPAVKKAKSQLKSPAKKKSAPAKSAKKTAAPIKKTAPKKSALSRKSAAKAKKVSAPAKQASPNTKPHATAVRNSRSVEILVSPLRDYVLVMREGDSDRTAGGLYIPETAKERPAQGSVVAVGPGGLDKKGRRSNLDVKVGDRVLFGKWSGTEVKIQDQDLLIMKESEILGVLD